MLFPEQLLKETIDKLAQEMTSKYQEYLITQVRQKAQEAASSITKPESQISQELIDLILAAFETPQFRIDGFSIVNQKIKVNFYTFGKIVSKLLKEGKLERDYETTVNGHPKIVRTEDK